MLLRFYIALCLIFATQAHAKPADVKIGCESFAPFFVEKGNTGIFNDLIKEAFSRMGDYKIDFKYMTRERVFTELKEGHIDGGFNVIGKKEDGLFVSAPVFRWSDFVYYKKSKGIKVRSFADFNGQSLATYQKATEFSGPQFAAGVKTLKSYRELPDQSKPAYFAANDRTTLAYQDIHTALYTLKEVLHQDPNAFEFVQLLPSAFTQMGFKNKDLRDKFDVAVAAMMKDGVYEKIYQKYKEQFGLKETGENLINLAPVAK